MARSSDVEYKMRMTQDLKEKIVSSAKEHNRSMNADIVARLENSFIESSDPNNMLSIINKLNERILELSKDSREMRMLYIETLQRLNKEKI